MYIMIEVSQFDINSREGMIIHKVYHIALNFGGAKLWQI